jgi:hypothetical protein
MSQFEPFDFPKLPILPDSDKPPEQPRLSNLQKYGGLYWLGIGGLVVSVLLVGWFAIQLWLLRDVWREIYVLHNKDLADDRRIAAATFLAKHPRVEAAQIQPMIFRRSLPDQARLLLAEGLKKTDTATSARQMLGLLETEGATSPPDYLRGHLARLAALNIPADDRFPVDLFRRMMADRDSAVAAWCAYGLTRSTGADDRQQGLNFLDQKAKHNSMMERSLLMAANSEGLSRSLSLQQAMDAMPQRVKR